PVRYLACHGVISGYADGTFRPYNNTTRAQMVKIVVLGFTVPFITPSAGGYTFTDVPPGYPFFSYIETAAADEIVSGYNGGGPGEPCDSAAARARGPACAPGGRRATPSAGYAQRGSLRPGPYPRRRALPGGGGRGPREQLTRRSVAG